METVRPLVGAHQEKSKVCLASAYRPPSRVGGGEVLALEPQKREEMSETEYPMKWTEEDYKFWDEYAKFAEQNPGLAQVIHNEVIAKMKESE